MTTFDIIRGIVELHKSEEQYRKWWTEERERSAVLSKKIAELEKEVSKSEQGTS